MDNSKWQDITFEKAMNNNLSFDDDYNKSYFTSETIYEFLKLCHKNGTHKLAGIITNKQRLFNVAKGSDHWTLTQEMLKMIYPDRQYGWKNPYIDGITLFSAGKELVINLPLRISQKQYESILKIINQVHQFENDFDTKVAFYADYILEQAQKRLSYEKINDQDEVIVGVSLAEELPKEVIEKEEKTNDFSKIHFS